MYYAEFEDGLNQIVQLLVGFPVMPTGPAEALNSWYGRLADLGQLATAGHGIDFTVRLGIRDGSFYRLVFLNSLSADRGALDSLYNGFSRLNDEHNFVVPCMDRSEYDAVLSALPPLCLRIRHEPLHFEDCELADDFRLLPSLAQLGTEALNTNQQLCWQGSFRSFHPSTDELRRVRRNLLNLEQLRNLPTALLAHQQNLTRQFESVAFLIAECLWLSEPLADTALALLRRRYADNYGRLGLADCPVTFVTEEQLQESLLALHPTLFSPSPAMESMSMAVQMREAQTALAWQPPTAWLEKSAKIAPLADSAGDYLKRTEFTFNGQTVFINDPQGPVGLSDFQKTNQTKERGKE